MGWVVNATARPLYPRERDPMPIVLSRRLDGPQGRYERVRKISPLPEFDLRTVQPVVSRYTDWAIAAHAHRHMPVLVHVLSLLYLAISVGRLV
jgi:hypothetical protein